MLIDILMWQGWDEVFFVWVAMSILFAAWPFDEKGRHHVTGAEIFMVEWIITNMLMGDMFTAPVGTVLYTVVDVIAGAIFLWFALNKKAVWAAVCVLTHFGMGLVHFKMYLGEWHSFYYVLSLNILYSISILSNNIGVWAGRYDRVFLLDRIFSALPGHPTFSGFRIPCDWRAAKGLG